MKKAWMLGFLMISAGTVSIVLSGCGKVKDSNPAPDQPTPEIEVGASPEVTDTESVVRGRFELRVGNPEANSEISFVTSTQPMTATVSANVIFSMSNANFATPGSMTGVASFGYLAITSLSDNDLRVCGAGGNQKCTTAKLRVYSTGTTGAGLWSTVEEMGLPISSSGNTVGLGSGAAYNVATVTIGTKRTLKLSDFTASAALQIPISVDFSDAPAGSYSTTLVVEYVLQ